jgi:CheY-specific phosphatase CheX
VAEAALQRALVESVEEVLEKMFFIEALAEPSGEAAPAEEVSARLEFAGSPSGGLELAVSRPAARGIAADFLAEEEAGLTDGQVGEVICELANMICGAMLSKVESDGLFHLSAPRIAADGEDAAGPGDSILHQIGLGGGVLRVSVTTDGP